MGLKPLFLHDDLDKYFYNRENDIRKIKYQIDSLNYSLPQQILITGVRGVGKTYLLKKLIKDGEENIIYSYIDISQVYALSDRELTIENVLIEMLRTMNDSIKDITYQNYFKEQINRLIENLRLKKFNFKDAGEILHISIPALETDYRKLAQFVMEFPQKVVDNIDNVNGFVIIFDEFQLLKKIDDLDKFFWLIRSFNQNQHNVSYIFTGSLSQSSEIIQEINGVDGAFGGRLQQINIAPFSKEETKSYFEERMSEIKFTDEGFERFYSCTKGIPIYINSFYNVMDSEKVYTPELVKETFYTNMDQILTMWIKVWSSLNNFEKNIVKELVEEDSLTWSELFNKTTVSRGTFNKYLSNIKDKGILLYSNRKYCIEDDMLKSWLKREKEINGFYPL